MLHTAWLPLLLSGVMLKYVILIHVMGSTIHLKNVVPFSLASMFSCEKPGITQAVIPLRIAHCFVAVIFLSYFRYVFLCLVSSFLITMCLNSFMIILFGACLAWRKAPSGTGSGFLTVVPVRLPERTGSFPLGELWCLLAPLSATVTEIVGGLVYGRTEKTRRKGSPGQL